jgi:hypothetical protein
MDELQLLPNTAAFAEDRSGSPDSQTYQSRQTLAFFRALKQIIRQAYSVDTATSSIAVTASPMTYTASDRVAVHVFGGTVTGLTFQRGSTSLAQAVTSAGQFVNLNPGDRLVITYTSAPTLTLVPR